MKQIKKKDLKEVIRLSKKWKKAILSSDKQEDDLYEKLRLSRIKAFVDEFSPLGAIILSIALLEEQPLKTYYKVFEALGYELV